MAVQDDLVPGTDAWARLSKKDRAKELARLGKSRADDRRKKSMNVGKRRKAGGRAL